MCALGSSVLLRVAPLRYATLRITAAYAKCPSENSASLRFLPATSHQARALAEIYVFLLPRKRRGNS